MNKMKMETPNLTAGNIEKIEVLFPGCITESKDADGQLKKAVNFELLRQMLSEDVVEGNEAYEFTWVGKKAAIIEANGPIRKTLRPCPEESVDWDTTENLYIEGDNLEVLKLLQESYLGKIKMIYIDPPYNTGNDFIYRDKFVVNSEEYDTDSGAIDEDTGNRLFKNTDTNGRFHSDWCSMIYSRLLLARNLLKDDGVIFISIDDNEASSLKAICDEIFGKDCFIANFVWQKKTQPSFLSKEVSNITDYIFAYKKQRTSIRLKGGISDVNKNVELINIGNPIVERTLPKDSVQIQNGQYTGTIKSGEYGRGVLTITLLEDIEVIDGKPLSDIHLRGRISRSQTTIESNVSEGAEIYIKSIKTLRPTMNLNRSEPTIKPPLSLLSKKLDDSIPTNTDASDEIKSLFAGVNIMDYPKPSKLIKFLCKATLFNSEDAIVLDFFSGSATTAHAVMQLNAERMAESKKQPDLFTENVKLENGGGVNNLCLVA